MSLMGDYDRSIWELYIYKVILKMSEYYSNQEMTDTYNDILLEMLLLRNIFTWKNFLIEKFSFLSCLQIFIFVNLLELAIETLASLDLYRCSIAARESHFKKKILKLA